MEQIRLKICGLRDNIEEVANLRPDYAGFIFYPKSPRFVGLDFEMPEIDEGISKAGVFVNESVDKIIEMGRNHQLQLVQLHGNESEEDCEIVRQSGVQVIKAFPMDDDFDFRLLENYVAHVDFFLFDTKTLGYGGSGKTFNWDLLQKYELDKPYFLSGGLRLENLTELSKVNLTKVHALDVNSRFEVKPGLKDLGMLETLKLKVEALNQQLATSH